MTLRDNPRIDNACSLDRPALSQFDFAFRYRDRHLRRAGTPAQSRRPLNLDWVEAVRREHQCGRTPYADHRHPANCEKRMAGGLASARHHLHGFDDMSGDDTDQRVRRLCAKARQPIQQELVQKLGIESLDIKVAAVCVYHTFVEPRGALLRAAEFHVAAVSTGFPAGLSPFEERVAEIRRSVEAGADEIDVVITRAYVFGPNGKLSTMKSPRSRMSAGRRI